MKNGKETDIQRFSIICWSLWISRNQAPYQNHDPNTEEAIHRADRVETIFQYVPHKPITMNAHQPRSDKWQPPQADISKVNVDAALTHFHDHFGIGMVCRNLKGQIVFAEGRSLVGILEPHLAEIIAIKEGVLLASKSNWSSWVVAISAVQAISLKNQFSNDALLSEEIRPFCALAKDASIVHCSRKANSIAHFLATNSLDSNLNVSFHESIPMFLKNLVLGDL